MSVCVISFSSRKNGNCAGIGELICSLLPEARLYRFSDFAIHPCGGCDYDCFAPGGLCPWREDKEYELLDAIIGSEQTYFVLPNYCDCPCANFFIFSERCQSYFQNRNGLLTAYKRVPKRAVVVSNTGEGPFRAALAGHACAPMEILFLRAAAYGSSSIRGDLMASERAAGDVRAFVRSQCPALRNQ